jgi:hypothetical protein
MIEKKRKTASDLKTSKEMQENNVWEPTKIRIFCGVTRVGW